MPKDRASAASGYSERSEPSGWLASHRGVATGIYTRSIQVAQVEIPPVRFPI